MQTFRAPLQLRAAAVTASAAGALLMGYSGITGAAVVTPAYTAAIARPDCGCEDVDRHHDHGSHATGGSGSGVSHTSHGSHATGSKGSGAAHLAGSGHRVPGEPVCAGDPSGDPGCSAAEDPGVAPPGKAPVSGTPTQPPATAAPAPISTSVSAGSVSAAAAAPPTPATPATGTPAVPVTGAGGTFGVGLALCGAGLLALLLARRRS